MTDMEIQEMQDQINKEAGMDTDDGGVEVPDNTDGITRYPQVDGSPIPPDEIDGANGNYDPNANGDDNEQ